MFFFVFFASTISYNLKKQLLTTCSNSNVFLGRFSLFLEYTQLRGGGGRGHVGNSAYSLKKKQFKHIYTKLIG